MTEPKRRGRPPRDPSSAPAGATAWHVGLRLNAFREEQMTRVLNAQIERARLAGLPTNITASSLIHQWIIERLEQEIAKLELDGPEVMRAFKDLAKLMKKEPRRRRGGGGRDE